MSRSYTPLSVQIWSWYSKLSVQIQPLREKLVGSAVVWRSHCWIIFWDHDCIVAFKTVDRMHHLSARHKITDRRISIPCNIPQSQDPAFPFPIQKNMSDRTFGSTLRGPSSLSLSLVVDCSTWSVMFMQVQQEVLVMEQTAPCLAGKSLRAMWCL